MAKDSKADLAVFSENGLRVAGPSHDGTLHRLPYRVVESLHRRKNRHRWRSRRACVMVPRIQLIRSCYRNEKPLNQSPSPMNARSFRKLPRFQHFLSERKRRFQTEQWSASDRPRSGTAKPILVRQRNALAIDHMSKLLLVSHSSPWMYSSLMQRQLCARKLSATDAKYGLRPVESRGAANSFLRPDISGNCGHLLPLDLPVENGSFRPQSGRLLAQVTCRLCANFLRVTR